MQISVPNLKKVDLLLCAFINNSRIKVFYCEIEEQGKTAMPPMFKIAKLPKKDVLQGI